MCISSFDKHYLVAQSPLTRLKTWNGYSEKINQTAWIIYSECVDFAVTYTFYALPVRCYVLTIGNSSQRNESVVPKTVSIILSSWIIMEWMYGIRTLNFLSWKEMFTQRYISTERHNQTVFWRPTNIVLIAISLILALNIATHSSVIFCFVFN